MNSANFSDCPSCSLFLLIVLLAFSFMRLKEFVRWNRETRLHSTVHLLASGKVGSPEPPFLYSFSFCNFICVMQGSQRYLPVDGFCLGRSFGNLSLAMGITSAPWCKCERRRLWIPPGPKGGSNEVMANKWLPNRSTRRHAIHWKQRTANDKGRHSSIAQMYY